MLGRIRECFTDHERVGGTCVGSSFDAWKMYDITKVEWHLFPKQIITLLGMFLVVAFSSSLDVAAIEMELGLPLDYNRELFTVGMSNLVSGLFGGYTGSYIFTQTTFNMRRGINNRLCGYMIVVGEIVIALLPVSVVSFIPKMFFGSLLVLIATELLSEWLVRLSAVLLCCFYYYDGFDLIRCRRCRCCRRCVGFADHCSHENDALRVRGVPIDLRLHSNGGH